MDAIKALLAKDPEYLAFARVLAEHRHEGVEETELTSRLKCRDTKKFVGIAQELGVPCRRLDVGGTNPLKFGPASPELLEAVDVLDASGWKRIKTFVGPHLTAVIVGVVIAVLVAFVLMLLGLS